jgi:hypothetical protein
MNAVQRSRSRTFYKPADSCFQRKFQRQCQNPKTQLSKFREREQISLNRSLITKGHIEKQSNDNPQTSLLNPNMTRGATVLVVGLAVAAGGWLVCDLFDESFSAQ